MIRPFDFLCRLFIAMGFLHCGVLAQAAMADPLSSDWAMGKQSSVRLIADPDASGAFRLGLVFRLAPGWKTYWRSPGDAGLPATFDWTGSDNARIGRVDWPAPRRYALQGFETFGYEDSLVLPILGRAINPVAPIRLNLVVDYLVCRQVCLPTEAHLRLDFSTKAMPRVWETTLDAWAARVPVIVPPGAIAAGIAVGAIAAGRNESGSFLDLMVRATPPLIKPDVMVEGLTIGVPLAPEVRAGDRGETILRLAIPLATADPAKLIGLPVTVTLVDPPRAVTVALTVTKPAVPTPASETRFSLSILLTALLGGIILNFMPCVLPVLSIKVLAVIAHAETTRWRWRAGFLMTAAGIVTAFLVLAALLSIAKAAGLAIGWGIQFQQPVFLASLAAVTLAFAANLLGLFEVPTPYRLAEILSAAPPRQTGHPSLAGNFMTGVLATVLATPCSAPFLGTAVGFGLAGSIGDIFVIFLCLGLGLASPYLVLAALPALARHLPRPGKWMVTLRKLLGLPLLATTVWLVTVIAGEAGNLDAWAVTGFGVLGFLGLALIPTGKIWRWTLVPIFLAMPGVALLWPSTVMRSTPPLGFWQNFDEARIAQEVGEGHTVFIDVTARWCLTCQVNEAAVLDKAPVSKALAAPGTIAMRADWTRPDPRISQFLEEYQRFGIPLYVVYGPGMPNGEALPEIVTPGLVMAALVRAGR